MNRHINKVFLALYRELVRSKVVSKKKTGNDQMLDAIYLQREFNLWLSKKFKEELNESSYPTLCSMVNFKKYLKVQRPYIKREEVKKTKLEIAEQLKEDNLKKVVKHEYDVDIVASYFRIEKILKNVTYNKEQFTDEINFLAAMKIPVVDNCREKNLPLQFILDHKYPILIPNTAFNFHVHLGRALIAYDQNKIGAFLSYQFSKWQKKRPFTSIVEHEVYNFVISNSPFDNNIRLSKIMEWVDRNRKFAKKKEGKVLRTLKVALNDGETLHEPESYFYWPHSAEKLKKLYEALLLSDKIEANNMFSDLFLKNQDFPEKPIVWKVKDRHLMYLLYLIYGQKNYYNSTFIHQIAFRIFRKKDGSNYDPKGLSTTLGQLIKEENEKKDLSPGLKSIREIVNGLALT